MYKLIINGEEVWRGSSMLTLIRKTIELATSGVTVELYKRRRAGEKWYLSDGGIW